MRQAPVGFHCPQCVADGRIQRRIRRVGGNEATRWLIGICVAVFSLEFITGIDLAFYFGQWGIAIQQGEVWRLVTAMFLHGSVPHILFNMMALWQIGSVLEQFLGRSKYLSLYFTAGIAGSVVSYLLNNPMVISVGASGAIFGLMGAYAILVKKLGSRDNSIWGVIGLNLAFGFIVPGIDWKAHVGGLIAGALFASGTNLTRR